LWCHGPSYQAFQSCLFPGDLNSQYQERRFISQAVASTSKNATDLVGIESVNNALDTGICAGGKEEKTDKDDRQVEESHQYGTNVALLDKLKTAINLAHMEVGDAPEDESEEAIEKRGHEGQNWE
jgi:hypothetical protein